MFGGLSIWELVLVFFIILLFFGAKRLPEIGRSLGEGIREFKSSVTEIEGEDEPSGPREIPSSNASGTESADKDAR